MRRSTKWLLRKVAFLGTPTGSTCSLEHGTTSGFDRRPSLCVESADHFMRRKHKLE